MTEIVDITAQAKKHLDEVRKREQRDATFVTSTVIAGLRATDAEKLMEEKRKETAFASVRGKYVPFHIEQDYATGKMDLTVPFAANTSDRGRLVTQVHNCERVNKVICRMQAKLRSKGKKPNLEVTKQPKA